LNTQPIFIEYLGNRTQHRIKIPLVGFSNLSGDIIDFSVMVSESLHGTYTMLHSLMWYKIVARSIPQHSTTYYNYNSAHQLITEHAMSPLTGLNITQHSTI
jgi:hypothetical protein